MELRGQGSRFCVRLSSEQVLKSEGDKMKLVDKRRLGHYAAGVFWWGWKTFYLSDSLKSAEIHLLCTPRKLLHFSKDMSIKVKAPPPLTLNPFPFSYNMCFIDHKAVTWIAVVVRCHCFVQPRQPQKQHKRLSFCRLSRTFRQDCELWDANILICFFITILVCSVSTLFIYQFIYIFCE